mmetsp:Transcript_43656/g.123388  ORF Transcript_43656/g.123388 Transcript_43656/m.123388 type:complete len:204 (-) Transcript_43656:743-1354(-)
MDSSTTRRSSSISAAVTVSGGMILKVSRWPVGSTRTPRSKASPVTAWAKPLPTTDRSNSQPTMRPRPRTSEMVADAAPPICFNPDISLAPWAHTLSKTRSCSKTSNVAMAAATATALPPYVPPMQPTCCTAESSGRVATIDSGYPDAMPLAETRMSGTVPKFSTAHCFPVRPKPHCTSSAMRRMSCVVHHSLKERMKPVGGTT